jgi:hypothetical protein
MTKQAFITCALLACTCSAGAQTIKPGLWEMSSKISSSDPQVQAGLDGLQQHLANMTPEQRRRMQQLMQQNGLQLDVGPAGAVQSRVCMTREMIARKEFPVQEGDCKQHYKQVSASKGKVAFSCTRPAISGEGEIDVLSDTSYRGRIHVRSAEHGNQSVDTDVSGTWLGADCGSVGPVSVPRAK